MSEKYKGYRTPKSIIGYAVRHYYRFKLSLRDVSEMLLKRGIEVSKEKLPHLEWLCSAGYKYPVD
jgi:putative transposase